MNELCQAIDDAALARVEAKSRDCSSPPRYTGTALSMKTRRANRFGRSPGLIRDLGPYLGVALRTAGSANALRCPGRCADPEDESERGLRGRTRSGCERDGTGDMRGDFAKLG